MTQQVIDVGAAPNDGLGDPIRTAFIKCNNNFDQLFAGGGASGIQNGDSNIQIATSGGDIRMAVNGTSNVVVVGSTGISVTGNVQAGNVSAAGFNGAIQFRNSQGFLSSNGNLAWDAGNLALYAFKHMCGNGGFGTDEATLRIGNINPHTIDMGGNATVINIGNSAGNVTFAGNVSVVGNITGAYFSGNGAGLTNINANFSNANVASYLPTYTGNITAGNISVTSNVTGAYFIGNGSGLTGVIAVANVGAATQLANGSTILNVPVSDGNIIGNIGGTGNIFVLSNSGLEISGVVSASGNIITAGSITATGNLQAGNIRTVGLVSATGNIAGSFYSGNGRQLTGQGMSFRVTAANSVSYLINGGYANTTITLTRGQMYNFEVAAINHPLWIKTDPVIGTGNAYSSGVTNNGAGVGTVGFQVPFDAPGILYYQCQYHTGMYGILNIVDGSVIQSGNSNVQVANNGNISMSSAGTSNVMVVSSSGVDMSGNVAVTGGTFRLPSFSTAQLANITGTPGDIVYNTDVNQVQAWQYDATATFTWVSLAIPTYQ